MGPTGWMRGSNPVQHLEVRDGPPFWMLALLLIADAVLYAVDLKVGLPTWLCVAIVVGIGIVAVGLLALERARTRSAAAAYAAVVLAMTGVFTWLAVTFPLGWSVPGYLQHAPGSAATAQSRPLATVGGHESCVIVRHDPIHILPTPYQRCVGWFGGGQVDYGVPANGPWRNGLVFSPGGSEPVDPDSCLRHLDGPWWATVSTGDPAYPCPFSFEFEGAG